MIRWTECPVRGISFFSEPIVESRRERRKTKAKTKFQEWKERQKR